MIRIYSRSAATLAVAIAAIVAMCTHSIVSNSNSTTRKTAPQHSAVFPDICYISQKLDDLAARKGAEPHTMFSILGLDPSDPAFTARPLGAQKLTADALILDAMKTKQAWVDSAIDEQWNKQPGDDAQKMKPPIGVDALEAMLITISGDFLLDLDARNEYLKWIVYDRGGLLGGFGRSEIKDDKGSVNWRARC